MALLIGEIGHNWNIKDTKDEGLKVAVDLIKLTANCGWDIAKFQLYDTDKIKKPGETNYEELKAAELSFDEISFLKSQCEKYGVEFLASVFDEERLQWTEKLGMNRYKIASRSIWDKSLVTSAINTGKEVIISLGEWKNPWLPDYNAKYLHCQSRRSIMRDGMYPINRLDFSKLSGISDHSVGNDAIYAAIKSGAKIIEKHITLDKNARGWDQPGSANEKDMISIKYFNDKCGV